MVILRAALTLVAAVLLVVHPRVDLLLRGHVARTEIARRRRGILARGRTRLRCRRRVVALDSIRGGAVAVDDDVHVHVRVAR